MKKLEQVIRDYLKDIYNQEYVGKIRITKLNPGYCIELGMPTLELGTIIYAELEGDEFLKFLRKELINRSSYIYGFGELNLILPYVNPNNVLCNDKGRIN